MGHPLATPFAPRSGRGGTWRLIIVLVIVAALVVAWFSTRSSGPAYRTAAVTTGTATATLDEVGTVTPVQQSNLTFAVAGTVGTVDVSVGQQVTAGQVVASLDLTSLDTAVVNAQNTLASAQATLATDETSEADGSSSSSAGSTGTGTNGSGSSGGSSGSGGSSTSGGSGGSSAASSAQVAQLQATLVADQHAQDAAAAAAGAALQQATAVCASSSTSSSAATGAASAATPAAGTGSSGGGSGSSGQTCTQALAAASSAHQALVAAIAQVTKDEAALAAALGVSTSSAEGSGNPSQGGSTRATTTAAVNGARTATFLAATSGSGTGSGSSSNSGRTGTVTPEVIALDEANVDVAQAALTAAQQDVDDVNLVTPISGTVGSVSLTTGQSVSAGSPTATPQVVVVGSGTAYEVATTVAVTDIQKVKVGQTALVTPDSSATPIAGTVTGIGVLGTTSTSTTTYPVTITLHSSDLGPYSGADATIQIVIDKVRGVVTVPSSAVRTVGTTKVVTVVDGGTTKAVRVTVGTVGALSTQIVSGVHVGETVSLATMDAPVPSSSTTSRAGLAGLGGTTGFGGTGGFGGTTGFGGTGGAGRFSGGGGFTPGG